MEQWRKLPISLAEFEKRFGRSAADRVRDSAEYSLFSDRRRRRPRLPLRYFEGLETGALARVAFHFVLFVVFCRNAVPTLISPPQEENAKRARAFVYYRITYRNQDIDAAAPLCYLLHHARHTEYLRYLVQDR